MTDKSNNVHKLNGSNGSGTLEDRIVAALQDPAITAGQLAELIADAEQGLVDADIIAARMHEIALDPVASPDPKKATEAAEFATLVVKRLRNVIPRLQQKHAATVTAHRRARWNEAADLMQTNRDFLATEFAELYPQFLNKLLELLQRVFVMNAEVDNLNTLALGSESRRLESLAYQPLLSNSKLLDLSGQQVWPPPPAPVNVHTIVPHLPAGGDWHETIAQRDAERRQQSAKAAQYYHQRSRDREEREAAEAKAARLRGAP